MQKSSIPAPQSSSTVQVTASDSPPSAADLARAIAVINARQYRPGEAFWARYSARFQPLMPDVDYIGRRGVDLMALADALGRGLNAELFGQVIQYTDWPIDEFNRFLRAKITCEVINSGMRCFLDEPRNWW